MPREIKFRAKRVDGMGWVYGLPLKTPITAEFEANEGQFFDTAWEGRWCIVQDGVAYEIDVKTIGQLTGMLDKKGRKIFEGDIVKIKGHGKCLVVYLSGAMKFFFEQIGPSKGSFTATPDKIEIVGNSFDNPKLLK